jgi:hypothetical protein
MSLSALIRKRGTGNLATAIPAISATQPTGEAATVARIATLAVANPKEEKTAPLPKVGAGDTATASRWWLLHFSDRESLAVLFVPAVNHAAVLASYPDAVAAEPLDDIRDDSAVDRCKDDDRACSLRTVPDTDDRRRCSQCLNLRGRVCTVAKPGGLVSANVGYRPAPDTLQRCAGYLPNASDANQQSGRERWPGLIQKGGE